MLSHVLVRIELASGSGNFQKSRLHKKIPDSACFIHINLDQVPGFAAPKVSVPPNELADKCFFNNKVRFGENAELLTQSLLCRG